MKNASFVEHVRHKQLSYQFFTKAAVVVLSLIFKFLKSVAKPITRKKAPSHSITNSRSYLEAVH